MVAEEQEDRDRLTDLSVRKGKGRASTHRQRYDDDDDIGVLGRTD